eukprot:676422-Rhodomonas_salina.1
MFHHYPCMLVTSTPAPHAATCVQVVGTSGARARSPRIQLKPTHIAQTHTQLDPRAFAHQTQTIAATLHAQPPPHLATQSC